MSTETEKLDFSAIDGETEENTNGAERRNEKEIPFKLRRRHPLFTELWLKGVNFIEEGLSDFIEVEGFYKAGNCRLIEDEHGLFYTDRRGNQTRIDRFDDLIPINFQMWRQANSRKGVYVQPSQPWLDEFVQRKMVKRQVLYIPLNPEDEGTGAAG